MLEMDERRISYIDQLRPSNGFVLNYAVGTTYSLDLGALLGVCISTTEYLTGEDPSLANRVKLFAAAVQAQEKITVFCEQGRIANNKHANELCVLLEGMIEQVVVKRPKSVTSSETSSFHPKVWIADYYNATENEHEYRLLIMSRNLTFDGSWDVVVRLDGRREEKNVRSSANIARFVRYLTTQASPERRSRLEDFAGDIAKVRFQVDTQQFEGFEFLPFGPRGSGLLDANSSDLLADSFVNLLVMSPFLGNTGPLPKLAGNMREVKDGRAILISRIDSLEKLNPELRDKFECHAPKSWLSEVEVETDGLPGKEDDRHEDIAAEYSQLHAKLYFTETYDARTLYLGSMNASYNGANNNVEALIALRGKKYKLLFNDIVKALVDDEETNDRPFERVKLSPGFVGFTPSLGEAAQLETDKVLHLAAKMLQIKAVRVVEGTEGLYNIEIDYELEDYEEDRWSLSIAPYLDQGKKVDLGCGKALIEGLLPKQVSEFFVIRAEGELGSVSSCLVCCPSELIDDAVLNRQTREKAVLDRILVADDRALEEYVCLAFGTVALASSGMKKEISGFSTNRGTSIAPSLYEDLLKGLSDRDEALNRLAVAKHLLSYLPERYSDREIDAMKRMVAEFEKAVTMYAK